MAHAQVSADFRVSIPEEIRRTIPIRPGQNLEIVAGRGVITLVPDPLTAPTLEELAAAQGVKPVESLDEVCGGWPEDELDDGFEDTVRRWRDAELRHEG